MAQEKLGEMLIEAGVLDEAQLRGALADQRRWGDHSAGHSSRCG